jgi:hypothetical protein
MNANLLRTAWCFCAVTAAGLSVLSGPLQRADVAAEPAWVVHVDCDRLRPTAVGQYLLEELEKPEAKAKLAEVQTVFAFDPRKQLHGLTLYSTGKTPQEGVLLIYGDFDPDRLISMVSAAQDYQTTPYKKHVIHHWVDDKKKPVKGVMPRVYAAIQGTHIIVLAQQELRVARALDVLDRAAPSLADSSLFPQLGSKGSANVIQAAARKFDLPESTPQAAVLRLAKGARLQVGEVEGKVRATLIVETGDPDVAQLMATVGQGLVALLKLQRDNSATMKLAEAVSLKQAGASVVASLAIPTDEVVGLLKADAARKAKKQTAKE